RRPGPGTDRDRNMSLQLLAGPTSSEEHQAKTNVDFWIYVGVGVIFMIFGVFGVWAALAHLTSAALALGVIAVDSNWRTIQHLEGGIVAEILVREGDHVQEGDVLLRLDPTRSDASLSILDSQLVLAKATEARLIAERDGADLIDFPEELIDRMEDQEVATVVAGQDLLFRARRDSMEGQINILNERVEQLKQQIEGLQVQQDARANQTALIEKELEGLQQLFDEGYASQQRILALQRDAERLRGERGENLASIASARSQIGETELQILQLDKNFREEVVNELRTVQSQVFDLQERRTAAADERRRIDIVAPVAG
ncbi:MAG: HlyD family type I secretion periplasmic adaptor subunit, partial [Proteobacteria bacterium]|nr:HlyD family type I secretion periplasmic adaptor subunit [Pseudomonadota bacterium]